MTTKKEESLGVKSFRSKLEKENEGTETLMEENVQKEFKHTVQCYENDEEIERVSPI